jgi:catechol 2,3-dioxygenase-like lactoylglutathione lyase family enzyme
MTSIPRLSFSHMGIYVADLARMEDFYTRVLGFAVTDRGELGATAIVFLSLDPAEHHQIILASGRPQDLSFNPINQVSFRLSELAALRQMARRLKDEGVRDLAPVSHGNALSVYFRDPESNRLELFVDTPWYVRQPLRLPMDLELPDAQLWAWAESEARKQPDFQPVERWRAAIAERLK